MREQMSQQSSFEDLELERASSCIVEDLELERASSCDAGIDPKCVAALFGTAAAASKATTALDLQTLSSSCASKLDSCESVESSPSCGVACGVHAVQAVPQDSDFHCSRADLETARSCYTAVTSIAQPSGADRARVPSDLMTAHPWRLAGLMGSDVGGGSPQFIRPFEKSPSSPSASSWDDMRPELVDLNSMLRAWYNRIVAAQMDTDNTDDETECTERRTSGGSSTKSGDVSSQNSSGGVLGPDHTADREGRGRSQTADDAPCIPFSRLCLQEADSSVSEARTAPISRLYLSLDVFESAELRRCLGTDGV